MYSIPKLGKYEGDFIQWFITYAEMEPRDRNKNIPPTSHVSIWVPRLAVSVSATIEVLT